MIAEYILSCYYRSLLNYILYIIGPDESIKAKNNQIKGEKGKWRHGGKDVGIVRRAGPDEEDTMWSELSWWVEEQGRGRSRAVTAFTWGGLHGELGMPVQWISCLNMVPALHRNTPIHSLYKVDLLLFQFIFCPYSPTYRIPAMEGASLILLCILTTQYLEYFSQP